MLAKFAWDYSFIYNHQSSAWRSTLRALFGQMSLEGIRDSNYGLAHSGWVAAYAERLGSTKQMREAVCRRSRLLCVHAIMVMSVWGYVAKHTVVIL
ncbi:hypothetical protein TcWFU_010496 [Taenia crassiceps]|uniref:Uncharacterized protein n=1 Tax=Taenia crassiceps TaxID=6207 RepID=A0ABR4QBN3_9CEST